MTSLAPIKSMEKLNGFVRLPEKSAVPAHLFLVAVLGFLMVISFVGLPFLIPPVLFFAGFMFNSRTQARIDESRRELALSAPGVRVLSRAGDVLVVDFFGKPKVVVGLDSFLSGHHLEDDWLTALALRLNRDIQGVFTTGGPSPHHEMGAHCHRLLLAEIHPQESIESLSSALKSCLSAMGISASPVDEAIFTPTAGHQWWHTQGHSLEQRMDVPLPKVIEVHSLIPEPLKNPEVNESNWTATVTVRPAAGMPNTIDVGLDVSLFAESKSQLTKCERCFFQAPRIKGTSGLQVRAMFPNIEIIRRRKLNFGAAFVAPPVEPTNRYKILTSAQRPAFRALQRLDLFGLK